VAEQLCHLRPAFRLQGSTPEAARPEPQLSRPRYPKIRLMKLRQSNLFIGAPLAQALCADDELRLGGKPLAQMVRQLASPIGATLAHDAPKAPQHKNPSKVTAR
jgi:hypothetical protein